MQFVRRAEKDRADLFGAQRNHVIKVRVRKFGDAFGTLARRVDAAFLQNAQRERMDERGRAARAEYLDALARERAQDSFRQLRTRGIVNAEKKDAEWI